MDYSLKQINVVSFNLLLAKLAIPLSLQQLHAATKWSAAGCLRPIAIASLDTHSQTCLSSLRSYAMQYKLEYRERRLEMP
jgi:hypothetical protein